jgi:hypothetical protein
MFVMWVALLSRGGESEKSFEEKDIFLLGPMTI